MDSWLVDRLTHSGVLDGDGFARRVTFGSCVSCKRKVLRGLDARTAGLPVTADATPLDEMGEITVLSFGWRTYDLAPMNRGFTLEPRGARHIRLPRRYAVVGTHRCDLFWPPAVRDQAFRPLLPDVPPF